MKTIPKRADLYTNPTDKIGLLKEQMSQLLEMKSDLSQKLKSLNKIINQQVTHFISRNQPLQFQNINLLKFKRNLFGNDKTFQQFSKQYTNVSFCLESDIKGVVQILQKFSFTKNLSVFITQGIVTNFIKIHNMMLKRQQFCTNVFNQMEKQVLQGKASIFSNAVPETSHCIKCCTLIQMEKIQQTKQNIIFGGEKINEFYRNQLKEASSDDQESSNTNIYERVSKIKRKIQESTSKDFDIISEEAMKFNLNKLQSNLEHRKYNIMACLYQMGEFGSQVKSQALAQDFEKQLSSKDRTTQNFTQSLAEHLVQKFALMPQDSIPPKFNFKSFTFDISKHFHKQIKDIQGEIAGIKKRFGSLLSLQAQRSKSCETQCNLIKDSQEQELAKHKKKTDRKTFNLNTIIKDISQENKTLKDKISEYQNLIKVYISSKLQQQSGQVQKIRIQMKIPRLIQRYENKIKLQQKQLKTLRQKHQMFNKQSKNSNQLDMTNQISQGVNRKRDSLSVQDKQNVKNIFGPVQKSIKANHLQAQLQKVNLKNPLQQKQQEKLSQMLSFDTGQKQTGEIYDQEFDQIPQIQKISKQLTYNLQQLVTGSNFVKKQLKILSRIIEMTIYTKDSQQILQTTSRLIKKNNPDRILNQNHKIEQEKQINQKTQTVIYDEDFYKNIDEFPKEKVKNKNKLTKVKSQTDNKVYRKEFEQEDKEKEKSYFNKKNKKTQLIFEAIKRQVSEHGSNLKKKASFSMKKHANKPIKALSVSFVRKDSQMPNSPNALVKLPQISNYPKSLNKNERLKQLQKKLSNKNSLLTKKPRKKRNFSQESQIMGSIFDNQQNNTGLDNHLPGQNKNDNSKHHQKHKKRKQYIIDVIPKIQNQSANKKNTQIFQFDSPQIDKLFNVPQDLDFQLDNQNIVKKDRKMKNKYLTKTVKFSREVNMDIQERFLPLSKDQISLSTQIYSLLAIIKSENLVSYRKIKQTLENKHNVMAKSLPLKRTLTIKNNCDQLSMNMRLNHRDMSLNQIYTQHFPLSMSITSNLKQTGDLSNQIHPLKSEETSIQSKDKKEKMEKNTKRHDQKQVQNQILLSTTQHEQNSKGQDLNLRRIIGDIIFKHRKTCIKRQKRDNQAYQTGMQTQTSNGHCRHLQNFVIWLKQFRKSS